MVASSDALLMIVVDGMGGHAHGARAAEVTVATLKESFGEQSLPVFDPQGFLTLSLARAHDRVLGRQPNSVGGFTPHVLPVDNTTRRGVARVPAPRA